MMWWYGNGMGGWGYAMMIGNVLFWALIIVSVIVLVRHLTRNNRGTSAATPRPTPEQLLAERFARSEIDEQEYRGRLDTLAHEYRPRIES